MYNNRLVWIAMIAVTLLAGCASHKPKPGASAGSTNVPLPPETSQSAGAGGANAQGENGAAATETPGAGANSALNISLSQNRVVYFDFDSSDIKPEYNNLIAAHAKNLGGNTQLRVRLEGNTDERGSREYNIGLGERRAQAVRQALMLQGVAASQITTVSYGEERPAVTGHTEEAWSKNRRVEIVYLN
jgi:peptidoglycan-associated lipoprotein